VNKEQFNNFIEVFLEQNARLNLISKNDEKVLWEKHICDSLAIEHFFRRENGEWGHVLPLREDRNFCNINSGKNSEVGVLTLLDIGTGGGFPAIPIAIAYPEIQVFALDSIKKKINALKEIKTTLRLENLHPICTRAEELAKDPAKKFDIITSRAVAPLEKLIGYAMPLLKPDGYFIAYKSLKAQEEIDAAKHTLKKHRAKVSNIIEYELPLRENHTRNLIAVKPSC